MAALRTDSPLSLSIVGSFLEFLSSVEPAPGTDTEGLEVATQCLSEVFGLHNAQRDPQIQLLPLVDLFRSGLGLTDVQATSGKSISGADHHVTAPLNGVSTHCEVRPSAGRSGAEPLTDEPATSCSESLLEQFREGLDLAGYFEGTMRGTPEYTERLDQAKQILEGALKKVKSSTVDPKWNAGYTEETLALAEAFKIQGNTTMSALRYHDAIQLYTLAISLCSNNAIFYSNRAAALTQVGKYGEALADCEVATKLDPQYSKAYSRMGLVYFAQGHLQDAIESFKNALELDPSSSSVKENLRAAQQKLEEQQRSRHSQEQTHSTESHTSGPFGTSAGTSSIPVPDIANLLPGLLNMTAMFGQQAQEAQQQAGADQSASNNGSHPGGVNFTDGDANVDPGVPLDGSFNLSFNGQQLPPQYAGLMQSVFQQMFGATSAGQNPNPQSGPPGGGS